MLTDNLRGAGIMCLSMALFLLNDTVMKSLSDSVVPLNQILVIRNGLVLMVFVALAWRSGALAGVRRMSRRDRWLMVFRGMTEVAMTYFYLRALFNMPLANVTAVTQSTPLFVMLGAAVFLSEPIGWRRVLAAVTGFGGVLLIIRPGGEGFSIFALYSLVSVLAVATRDILTRLMSRDVPTLVITSGSSAMVVMYFGLASLGTPWVAVDVPSLGLIALAAVLLVGAYVASVQAMRVGEVSFVSPFRYTALIWALVLGWVVFGDWPVPLTLLGAAIVVGSGLYSFFRELRLGHRSVVPPAR